MPDTALLLNLSVVLKTTVDNILYGGTVVCKAYKKISIADVIKGFEAMDTIRQTLGTNSLFYQGMVEGINQKMNMDIETHLATPKERFFLYAEAILQAIQYDNAYVDMDEIKAYFDNEKIVNFIQENRRQD